MDRRRGTRWQILATHDSSLHDNCKVVFPFENLEMTPPYRWFNADGQSIDEAHDASPRV